MSGQDIEPRKDDDLVEPIDERVSRSREPRITLNMPPLRESLEVYRRSRDADLQPAIEARKGDDGR